MYQATVHTCKSEEHHRRRASMPSCEIGVYEKPKASARQVPSAGSSSRRAVGARPPPYTPLGTFKLDDSWTTQKFIKRLSDIFGEAVEPAHIVSNMNAGGSMPTTHFSFERFIFLSNGYSAQAVSQPCVEYINTKQSLAEDSPVRIILQRVRPNPAAPPRPVPSPPPQLPPPPVLGSFESQGPAPKQPQPQPTPPPGSALPPSCCRMLLGSWARCCAVDHSMERTAQAARPRARLQGVY